MFYQRNEKVYWLFLFVLEENWLKAFSSRTFEFAVHRLTFHTMLCIRLSADPIDYEANLIWFVGNWKCMQEPFISWITKSTQANWNWNWKKKWFWRVCILNDKSSHSLFWSIHCASIVMWSCGANISTSLTLTLLTEVKPWFVWDLPASARWVCTPLTLKGGVWLSIMDAGPLLSIMLGALQAFVQSLI